MPLTQDWQVEIRGTVTGAGTDFQIEEGGISGLGVPPAKTNDVDRGHASGAYFGRDYTGVRVITIPYVISVNEGTDAEKAANAGGLFLWLCDLWEASETDIVLAMQLPGFGQVSFEGRPRGLVDDLSRLSVGVARGLATFMCGYPEMLVDVGS